MIIRKLLIAAAVVGGLFAVPASAETVDVYQVGGSSALDPLNTPIPGSPSITWTHTVTGLGGKFLLSILAEGIDSPPNSSSPGEIDNVFFNDTFIGSLTQQGFYSPFFNLQPGPGALPGFTALSTSIFDVTSLVILGLNTVRVDVDPSNWVNEIETSTLEVPLPAALPMLATALGVLGAAAWRRRQQVRSVA